jgi:hypothetical protein
MKPTQLVNRSIPVLLTLSAWLAMAPARCVAATARVQYVSATYVYLDAGRAAGLAEGGTVSVQRQGKEVARLTVAFLSENSSACRVEPGGVAVRPGDACAFTAGQVAARADTLARPVGADSASGASAGAGDNRWMPVSRWRGQVSTSYTQSHDAAGEFRYPVVSGEMSWASLERGELAVRGRAGRPSLSSIPDPIAGTRLEQTDLKVYELGVRYRSAGKRLALEAGRQLPTRLETLGYLDGGGIRWRGARSLAIGAAGGRSADLNVSGFAAGGVCYGGYLEAGKVAPDARHRWRTLLGGGFIGDSALARRQYAFMRTDLSPTARLHTYGSAEVDFNPRWKQDLGEQPVELSTWSAGGDVWLANRWTLAMGIDSCRPVLMPEQAGLPTTAVLERYSGLYLSTRVQLSPDYSLRVGGDLRRRDSDGDLNHSWDAGLNSTRLLRGPFSGSAHVLSYDGSSGQGILVDGSLAARVARWSRLEVGGGVGRSNMGTDPTGATTLDDRSQWIRVMLDVQSARGLWMNAAQQWRTGSQGNESTLELGYSF